MRKKRVYPTGPGWSWAVSSSKVHAVQSLHARKVGKSAGTRLCPSAMVHCSSMAVSQAGCRLRSAEAPLLVSSLRTGADSELVQLFLLTEQGCFLKRGKFYFSFLNVCTRVHVCTCMYADTHT